MAVSNLRSFRISRAITRASNNSHQLGFSFEHLFVAKKRQLGLVVASLRNRTFWRQRSAYCLRGIHVLLEDGPGPLLERYRLSALHSAVYIDVRYDVRLNQLVSILLVPDCDLLYN